MKFKLKLKKTEWEALEDGVKAMYVADGDNYKLDVDDSELAAEMRRARDREKQEKAELQTKLDEMQEQLTELQNEGGKKKGDVDALERSYKDQLEKQKTKFEGMITKFKDMLKKLLVSDIAKTLASEISTSPALLLPHIERRLTAELDGDEPITRVLGVDGKPSALSVEQLKQEFVDSKDFAPIIIGSKASGSGGIGGNGGSGGAKKPADYTEQERTQLYQSNRAEFFRLFPAPN